VIAIRRARVEDAAALAALATKTFLDAYSWGNKPEDMAAYVAENFTEAAIAKDLVDPRATYLVGSEGPLLVGYVKLFEGAAPACVKTKKPIELARIYLEQTRHGSGAGAVLLNAALIEAGRLGARSVWLGVWEKNERARAFYAKHGFEDVGVHEFVLGADVQQDRILVRALKPA
jgi:GNAT superfamily N-acetyltransferase